MLTAPACALSSTLARESVYIMPNFGVSLEEAVVVCFDLQLCSRCMEGDAPPLVRAEGHPMDQPRTVGTSKEYDLVGRV
jgi:hypothetical protein